MPTKEVIEARSFDFVPEAERRGTIRSQFQLWFMINATLVTLYTGAVGPLNHLDLFWTMISIVCGVTFGTLFEAFHGAQGPRMGLPQMIQSRVQFGSRGAVVPLVAATISQFGFAVFFIQTGARSAANVVAPDRLSVIQVAVGLAAMAIAIVGYPMLLRAEKLASFATVANFAVLSVAAATSLSGKVHPSTQGFQTVPFLAQFGASATYQIAIAPIVSDYTRYLPSRPKASSISAAVFFGTALSAVWLEGMGAVLGTAHPDADLIESLRNLGDGFGFGLGSATMVIGACTCLVTAAIAFYSGALALLSAAEAFRPTRPTAGLRSTTIAVCGAVAIAGCSTMSSDILNAFSSFLSILGYFLIPWTAVNLTDYYIVRRGRFSLTDIMRPDGGIYGRWSMEGLLSYLAGFVATIPFFSTSLYTGPVATALDKADVAFAVGLLVSVLCYVLLIRRRDIGAELERVRLAPPQHARSGRRRSAWRRWSRGAEPGVTFQPSPGTARRAGSVSGTGSTRPSTSAPAGPRDRDGGGTPLRDARPLIAKGARPSPRRGARDRRSGDAPATGRSGARALTAPARRN